MPSHAQKQKTVAQNSSSKSRTHGRAYGAQMGEASYITRPHGMIGHQTVQQMFQRRADGPTAAPGDTVSPHRFGEVNPYAKSKQVSATQQTKLDAVSGGKPLSKEQRAFFEPRFGADFSRVRIHTDRSADSAAQAVDALAYTRGRDIAFRGGQYQPDTVTGSHLLAHELTHVIQQGGAMASESGLVQRRPGLGDTITRAPLTKSIENESNMLDEKEESGRGATNITTHGDYKALVETSASQSGKYGSTAKAVRGVRTTMTFNYAVDAVKLQVQPAAKVKTDARDSGYTVGAAQSTVVLRAFNRADDIIGTASVSAAASHGDTLTGVKPTTADVSMPGGASVILPVHFTSSSATTKPLFYSRLIAPMSDGIRTFQVIIDQVAYSESEVGGDILNAIMPDDENRGISGTGWNVELYEIDSTTLSTTRFLGGYRCSVEFDGGLVDKKYTGSENEVGFGLEQRPTR